MTIKSFKARQKFGRVEAVFTAFFPGIFLGIFRAGFLAALLSCLALFGSTACVWAKERSLRGIQAGARADLELLRAAEAAYYKQAGTYTTDLGSLPFRRKDLTALLYKFGFTQPMAANVRLREGPKVRAGHDSSPDESRDDLDLLKLSRPDIELGYSPVTKLNKIDFQTLRVFCSDCTATKTGFKALAAANLDDDPTLDLWTIDQDGKIEHLVDDLKR